MATFGEKYGQTVRVVTMGDFSMELCGGTHLDNTAKAGPFRIKSESSVASGVRRIEATTGKVTMEDMRRSRGLLNRASQFFKSAPETLMERLEQQASEMKALRQALEKFKSEASMGEAKQILGISHDDVIPACIRTERNTCHSFKLSQFFNQPVCFR